MHVHVLEKVLEWHLLVKGDYIVNGTVCEHVLQFLNEFLHEQPLAVQVIRLDPDFRIVF